jgi:putative aldouronate transport system permease protein
MMIRDKSLGSTLFDIFLIIVSIALAALCVFPLWYTFCISLSEKSKVAAGLVTFWPVGLNFNSYTSMIGDPNFLHSFWISIERVVLGTALELTATILLAFPLSRTTRQFRARDAVMWFLVFAMLFSGGVIPWYQTMKSIGMFNNIWGLVLGNSVPIFNVILMVNFFRGIPREIEEAALLDGAGPWTMLFRIYLPLSTPSIATVSLFSIVYHWNEFFNGLVLTTRQINYPLQTYIQQMIVVINTSTMTADQIAHMSELSDQTLGAAKIFIAIVPILLIYPFIQRYFISGLTVGSVKE